MQLYTHSFPVDRILSARLQAAIKRPTSQVMGTNDIRALSILIFIVSLLGENCNFDELRNENAGMYQEMLPTCPHFMFLAQNLLGKSMLSPRSVCSLLVNHVILINFQGPIIEHIYNSLLQLYEKYDASTLQGRILQCLGTPYHL